MKKAGILIALFLLTALGGCLSSEKTPADLLEPRENSDAGIRITATYLPNVTDATAFEIEVTAHMDYNDDFKNISYLRDSSGKIYQPVLYEGSGGHHASGMIKFPRIEGKRFELVIQNIANVKERVFTW